jgi:hypothetical protein
MCKRTIGLPILAAALLAALAVTAAFAGEEATQVTAPAAPAETTAAPAGCGADLDLASLATPGAAVCPAAPPETTVPDFITLAGRTCRCSCGFPCKRDSDCGPGGICAGGITCC